jgi:hypothetical protein
VKRPDLPGVHPVGVYLAGADLPDKDDRHVVAAALAAEAQFICTHNLRHFPADVMASLGLIVVTPDELLGPLIAHYPDSMIWVHEQSLGNLRGSTNQSTLAALRNADAPETADRMAQVLGL